MKIVLDTNIYISAFLFGGQAYKVYDYCVRRENVFISDFITEEIRSIFHRKFHLTNNKTDQIVENILSVIEIKRPAGKIPEVCRDKDDNNILHLAKSVSADFIITGDKDLLEIKVFGKTTIVSPKEFIDQFIS